MIDLVANANLLCAIVWEQNNYRPEYKAPCMEKIYFDWDTQKALYNERCHGVSFKEAESVFYNEYARLAPDLDHSQYEDRDILWGMSSAPRLIVISHVYHEVDKRVRIISARQLTKQELTMKNEYDFSQSVPNPYLRYLNPKVSIPIDEEVVIYFQQMAQDSGVPYYKLVNFYLWDCVHSGRRLSLEWKR